MVVRRVVYRLLFPLAFVLPLWVLIGRGILLDGIGWDFLVYLFACPVLFVALVVVGALLVWRPGAREQKAVSGWGSAVMIALWVALVASGFVAHPALVAASVVLVLVAFWLAVWELIAEGRRRLQAVMDDVNATTRGARASVPPQRTVDLGEVIVVTSEDVTERRPGE
ncbi:MFS transporter [Homoserinibacter sp. GY 40078]|uniref:MFS transporter n=1 Tax=Homoserinibacter sp. GY 40078 TaxID=2603275 RepID=UPI0011CBBD00|nr:MFS transporter [Homoserinibacter sp. GY 40078]TXK17030.1 MFS transporter [Homoserinibacter sp. GY 40078]